jgi:lipid-binding SYLF domain-containing protein
VDRLSSTCAIVLLLQFILACSNAHAQEAPGASSSASTPSTAASANDVSAEDADEARMRVTDAMSVVRRMKSDSRVSELVQNAKGLLIVPHFIKAAFVIGGNKGAGVLLVQNNGRWSDPAFYRTGSGSFGAQIGGAKGALVMILMSNKAVESYAVKTSSWSMSAGAGLTAAHYSKDTAQSGTTTDVIVWSDTTGLFGGAAVGATRVASDERANRAYYNHTDVTPQEILSGFIANPYSNKLREVLPMQRASEEDATRKEAQR